jgi:hypothetical protein
MNIYNFFLSLKAGFHRKKYFGVIKKMEKLSRHVQQIFKLIIF